MAWQSPRTLADLPGGAMIVWTLAGCGIVTRALLAFATRIAGMPAASASPVPRA